MSTLFSLTSDALERLGDLDNAIWSRDEIALYLRDGYDQFCRRTLALYDQFVIPNIPKTGNWQTDLERYLAEQKSGFGLTDEPFHFTGEHERNLGTDGRYGGTYHGPVNATIGSDIDNYSGASSLPTLVPGGPIPDSTAEVLRVTYDQRTLPGMGSAQMRQLDPNYERRSGDPQWFIYDKDGLFYIRVVPVAQGDADYNTVDGSWGTFCQTDESGISVSTVEPDGYDTGGYGIYLGRDGDFPSGGPWGTVTQKHPDTKNIKVEVYRLGLDLRYNTCELPLAFQKYIVFWAIGEALKREGPGQQLELAEHYKQRFEMGVNRLMRKRREMDSERIGRFSGPIEERDFGMGFPQPPYPYGVPH